MMPISWPPQKRSSTTLRPNLAPLSNELHDLRQGRPVKYYLWVKLARCPECEQRQGLEEGLVLPAPFSPQKTTSAPSSARSRLT